MIRTNNAKLAPFYTASEKKEVLDTTRISEDDRKKYQKVVDEFHKYFKAKKNVMYECA